MKPITHNGRVITDEEIQAMADQAEAENRRTTSNLIEQITRAIASDPLGPTPDGLC